ncbi:MAG: glucosamine-6-phosphate deaminase [Lentisphaerota bacterium]
MEVIIRPTAESAAALTANLIARALHHQPKLVLGLATGRTMERVYAELARRHREDGLDFSLCRTFNLDEYVGLAPEHPDSYRQYMNRLLFRNVNIDPRNTHVLNGIAPDLGAECARYERQIVECGGIDLQLLGIGSDGHIGFNEPLSALQSRTREKALTPSTRGQNAALFGGDMQRVPARALTMGVGTIQESRRCLLLVTGKEKAAILARAVEGPISAMVTASALQLHPRCTVIVDEDAAADLQGSEYYRWVFATEPEWAEFR